MGDEADDVLQEVIAKTRERWIEDARLEFISATETSLRWQDFMRLHEIADGWPEYKETAWEEWRADTLARKSHTPFASCIGAGNSIAVQH